MRLGEPEVDRGDGEIDRPQPRDAKPALRSRRQLGKRHVGERPHGCDQATSCTPCARHRQSVDPLGDLLPRPNGVTEPGRSAGHDCSFGLLSSPPSRANRSALFSMRRHRTTARATLVALLLAGLAAAASSAPASGNRARRRSAPRLPARREDRPLGQLRRPARQRPPRRASTWRTPGARRSSPSRTGAIKYWESGLGGCMLYHYGASGTTYLYIHLNNDLTPRNDNKGGCVEGRRVRGAGRREGDRRPADRAGTATRATRAATRTSTSRCTRTTAATSNPFRHLKRATKPLFAARKGAVFSLGLRGTLRRGGRGRGDARGRPGPPVPRRPLARDRHARARADRPARRRRRAVARRSSAARRCAR